MEDGTFYTYTLFVLVACAASVHLFHTCGQSNLWCKALYALGTTVILYVVISMGLESATSETKGRQRTRQLVGGRRSALR